ncbi:MAG: SGNH/GDSL hydrolase family protein [Pseudomonadales bacterium]|nr:SGNH/GDSL hydrolase family protein [Pseudomonadales bacterium]
MSDSDSQRMLSLGAALGFLPVAAMQRARLRLGAASTPLPVGASEGEVGELSAPSERLLVLGDASALGAGCDEVEAALAPRLAFGVALRRRTRIHWTARGGAGWTAARLDADLQRRGVPAADAALLVIGVNDALAMTPLTAWRRQLDRIVTRLFVAGVRLVAVSGLPPVQRLPGLAWPLAPLLALRVAQLDRAARRIAHPSPLAPERTIAHVPLPEIDPHAHVAEDGMHASPAGYAWWAACAADHLARELDQLPAPPRTASFRSAVS